MRENVGLKYGENTESITFAMNQASDFIVKTQESEEIKITLHTYWKQQNIYVSSEYREGENMRVLVYEDNYRILSDHKFYTTWGLEFTAEKSKSYTVRFIDEGSVQKLIAMEVSKTISSKLENTASPTDLEMIDNRLQTLREEMKVKLD